ncbi:MAG TPA: bifunctional 5,10-methylenetetrahydrofolate dehydrogenase/5,10-methenyltetrahydrofolate cyclohydrolase [Thermoanaerobaculia bacterium]|nr:bifunctional 5,10-methylenetetrahydrofolate dehydrogenase/5,10-methenyltetrahydrofolate cyclohydrolase [Thermoanaerobaculia bacterium]
MTRLLAGKPIADALRAEVAAGVRDLAARGLRPPGLSAVLVGEEPASRVYVASKIKACAEAGLESRTIRLPATATEDEILAVVDAANADPAVDGLLVQLPLPRGVDERRVIDRISPEKDVDGFHPVSVGRLWLDQPGFVSATPAGILALLTRSAIPLAGQHAVVVGRSAIVGKPMAALLLRESCTVTVCHSKTRDLAAITSQADLLIAAIGRPAFLGPEHVKEGAVVIDVGINRITDRAEVERLFPGDAARLAQLETRGQVIVGDVDFTRVAPKAAAITPVPGGVGLLTVAMLLVNTLTAARLRQGLPPSS